MCLPTLVLTLVNTSFGIKEISLAITLPVLTNLAFIFIFFCSVHNVLLNYHCLMLYFTVSLLPLFPYVITISPSLAI